MKINLNKLILFLLAIIGFILPIQQMFYYSFNLPAFVQPFYLVLIIAFIILPFIPYKIVKYNVDKKVIILFIALIIVNIISILVNYDTSVNYGLNFYTYVGSYSKFWDNAEMRMFGWGIMRPSLYLLYIFFLFIFLSIKESNVHFLFRVLIILAVASSIMSIYQIIAAYLNLPFGDFFCGQHKELFIAGIRRTEGLFYEPGPQAQFFSPIFCILFFQLFEKNPQNLLFSKKKTLLFLILITSIMFFTISPIAYVTPLISIPYCLILQRKHIKINKRIFSKIISILFVVSIILIGFISVFIKQADKRFSIGLYMMNKILVSTTNLNSPIVYLDPDARSVRNYAAKQMFKDSKLVGVGPGNAIVHFAKYTPFTLRNLPGEGGIGTPVAVYNSHYKILCESGIVGFSVYLLIILYPFLLYWKNFKYLTNNKLFINSLLIGHFLTLILSFQSVFYFYMHAFWLFYVPLVVLLNKKGTIINEYIDS